MSCFSLISTTLISGSWEIINTHCSYVLGSDLKLGIQQTVRTAVQILTRRLKAGCLGEVPRTWSGREMGLWLAWSHAGLVQGAAATVSSCKGAIKSQVGSRQRPKMKPMGGNREWPDRKASLLGKEPWTECYRAAGHGEAWASEDSMQPLEAFKYGDRPEQKRSLGNSKTNHYKQTKKKSPESLASPQNLSWIGIWGGSCN